jgi:chromosome segregation ATPase
VDAKRGYIEITEAIESVAALQDVYGSIYAAWQRSRTQLKAAKAETAKLQENYARVTESLNGWRRSSLRAGQQMEALKEELRVASNKLHQCQVDVGACRADLTLLHAEHKAQKTALPKVLSKKDKRARDREMRAQQKTGGKRSSRRQR